MRTASWGAGLVMGVLVATLAASAPAQDSELPAGHPPLEGSNPHARAGGDPAPGIFQPPEDTEQPDPSLPAGTIVVDLRDADDHPITGEAVTLGILINSVAKGDSRKHQQARADGAGRVAFAGLDTASNTAYRVTAGYMGGSFAAAPFQLQQAKSMHVVLHVYPVTHDVREALIVCEATIAAEVRDDRIQIEEAVNVYNLGRGAWQPLDVTLPLPAAFTAFDAQMSMSDQGFDQGAGAAKLRGTFPPGRHNLQFRFQVPWSGDKDVDLDVGVPPHVAIARVMMPGSLGIKLAAAGFPAPELRRDQQGQSFLVTERRMRPEDPVLRSVSIGLRDLPSPGPGRVIASVLAACGVAIGLVFAASRTERPGRGRDARGPRDAILEELAQLETARRGGDVGPRSYERARRELIGALARTLLKT